MKATRNNGAMGSKGQIAAFLIVGILLLVAAGIVLHIKGKLTLKSIFQFEPLVDEVPLEFRPIKVMTDECIEKISVDGLTRIGMHGGYIDVTPETRKYTNMLFKADATGLKPTEADVIGFSPGSSWQVPYWHYLATGNDCTSNCRFTSLRPPLTREQGENSIEEQMDKYVADQLPLCLGNFTSLKQQGFIVTQTGQIEAKTLIGDQSVNVYVHLPLTAQNGRATQDIANFGVTIPLNLKEVYDLATEITNIQMDARFLEGNALNVIGGFQGVDRDKLPPYAATDFSSKRVTWNARQVQEKIQDYLAAYTQRLRIANTLNGEPYAFDDPIQQGLYDSFVIPENQSYPDVAVEFNYLPLWPVYFSAGNGGKSQITATGAAAVGFPLSWLPLKQYQTPYDLSFPVIVELDYPAALHNMGYKFYFALEGNIRNNNIINGTYAPLQKVYFGGTSLFCEENQRNSGDVTVTTRSYDGKPAPDISIYFTARESCLVGSTVLKGNKASFTGKFPVGIGTLLGSNPDYLSTIQPFATKPGKAEDVTLTLYPYKTKKVKVMQRYLIKTRGFPENETYVMPVWMWSLDPSGPRSLDASEEAIMTYERVKENPAQEDVGGSVELNGDETKEISLVPGTYKISTTLLQSGLPEIIIPKDSRGGFIGIGSADLPQVEVPNDPYYGGTTDATVTIDPSDVYADNTFVVYGMYVDLPDVKVEDRKHEDMEEMGKTETQYSQLYADELQPRFE